jgi:hypothetical protein
MGSPHESQEAFLSSSKGTPNNILRYCSIFLSKSYNISDQKYYLSTIKETGLIENLLTLARVGMMSQVVTCTEQYLINNQIQSVRITQHKVEQLIMTRIYLFCYCKGPQILIARPMIRIQSVTGKSIRLPIALLTKQQHTQ